MIRPRPIARSAIFATILLTSLLVADDPAKKPKKPFTISKETTYATAPLREGGYIDYVAALNERAKQGVTPENNAMVLLVRALGPAQEGVKTPDNYYQALGCETPPVKGNYFRQFDKFLKESNKPAMELDPMWDLLRQLATRPWSRTDYPDAASWVDAHAEPLRWVHAASVRTHMYSPSSSKTQAGDYRTVFNMIYGSTSLRNLGDLLLCRAMLRVNEGKFIEAKEDILACHRLARLTSRSIHVIDLLEGSGLETQAIQAATSWLQQPNLPIKLIEEYLRELQQLQPMAKLADKVDGGERLHLLDTIMLVSQHGFKYLERLAGGTADSTGFRVLDFLLFHELNWDPALKKANSWYDRLVAALNNTDRTERLHAVEEIETELKLLRKELASEYSNRIAESKESRVQFVYDMSRVLLTTAIFKVQISVDRTEQQQRHLQLAIALARYQREKGAYPAKLAELTPKYLPTIPFDLFSGKDVIYSRTAKGYRLYSVGPNGKDDGGIKDDEPNKADDIVLEVPLLEGKK